MAEFHTPAGESPRRGNDVRLVDRTGISLVRRFTGESRPGTARRNGDLLEWSVSPGEWTVAGSAPFHDDVDLTHVRAVYRLNGGAARSVLERACALNLADDMFPNGAAARTLVASVATEVVRDDRGGERSYVLLPSRSFGGYLWRALVAAGAEFGLA